jgi:hypothetical protein
MNNKRENINKIITSCADEILKKIRIFWYICESSIILIHYLIYGNTRLFYSPDLAIKKGQLANGEGYCTVSELNLNCWDGQTYHRVIN